MRSEVSAYAQHIVYNSQNMTRSNISAISARISSTLAHPGFRKYFASTGWSLMSRVLGLFISFFVTIYMVRYLGPENYGQLSYAVSFAGIFSIVATLGMDSIIYRDLVTHPERRGEFMGTALGLKLLAGVFASLLTILSALIFSPKDISLYLIIIIAFTYIFNSFNIIVYEFQARVQQKYPALISLAIVIILNTLKVLVFYFDKGVYYLSFILLLESILYAALYVTYRRKIYGAFSDWHFKKETARYILKSSWPLIITAVFSVIYTRIDQVMIKNMIDAGSVGIYDAAVRLSEAWNFIPGIIASSLFPAIINAKKISIRVYKRRLLGLIGGLVALALAVAVPTSLLSSFIVHLLYGSSYAASASVLSIYIWSGIWFSMNLVLQYFLINEHKPHILFYSSLLAMLINVGLNFYLIPIYGINGAAWATFISYIVLSLPAAYILRLK
jgi:O-antigen/teichoic acid export membrane protein